MELKMKLKEWTKYFFLLVFLLVLFSCNSQNTIKENAPNIILIMADDWSYPHAGFYGDSSVRTPTMDRLAQEGVVFEQAFVSAPSCTPSRAAVLSGQHFWRLGEGANLFGRLPAEVPLYTRIMKDAGYAVGFADKGWGPGSHDHLPINPAGAYFESFKDFTGQVVPDQPFCFWFGSYNPHRGYEEGSGRQVGVDISKISLPKVYPESDVVRSDMADYLKEVQDLDDEVTQLVNHLTSKGLLDNTIIIVTSDNGMPFPRAKGNLYDLGTRVPLIIWSGKNVKQAVARNNQLISLTDLAPTFLDWAGLEIPKEMTGKSLVKLLEDSSYKLREAVFFGRERHVPGQENGDWGGYPMRAVRTQEYLLIKNFSPDRWPAGTPNYEEASFFPSYYSDIDGGPTRAYMIHHQKDDMEHQRLFEKAFGKRPAFELYDIKKDPYQLENIFDNPTSSAIKIQLQNLLSAELIKTKDPRQITNGEIFEQNNYDGGAPFPTDFVRQGNRYATLRIDSFPSKWVIPRPIEVLFPVNVSYSDRLPVIYMLDGQNIFHPNNAGFGKKGLERGWDVDFILDSLNETGFNQKAIIVGVFNTGIRRRAEYMPEEPREEVLRRLNLMEDDYFSNIPMHSDNYLRFMVEELKPYIDTHFKTLADREHTFIAGSSMGGMISAYAISKYPEIYGGAACLSTHWLPLEGVFVDYFEKNLPDPTTHKLYFDFGTKGLDARYEPYQKEVDQAMHRKGYKKGINWITKKVSGADHSGAAWHRRFHEPLIFLLSNN